MAIIVKHDGYNYESIEVLGAYRNLDEAKKRFVKVANKATDAALIDHNDINRFYEDCVISIYQKAEYVL